MIDLTPYMLRYTAAAPDRLRLTVYVAPGRADDLCQRLKQRGIRGWVHSSSTVRIEDPTALREVTRVTTDPSGYLSLWTMVESYCRLKEQSARGQERPKSHVQRLKDLVKEIVKLDS